MLTAGDDAQLRQEALELGAIECLTKPVHERILLSAIEGVGTLSEERLTDLRDAFEFIAYVRLRHQAQQVRAGADPDDFVPPDELSQFEKRHLRDAFQIVRQAQAAVSAAYPIRGQG